MTSRARAMLTQALAGARTGARTVVSRARTTLLQVRSAFSKVPASLRRSLLPEGARLTLSWSLAAAVGLAAVLPVRGPVQAAGESGTTLPLLLILFIVMISASSLAFAGLTLWVMRDLPRHRLVAAARLPRARRAVRTYRWYMGRSSALSEVVQMLAMAALAAGLLIVAPEGMSTAALLALTAGAVVSAWLGAVVTFAVEYTAEDADGTAFTLPGTEGTERTFQDYVHGAVLIQASSGSSDLAPRASRARRLVRHQVVLAYVMTTIITTLGVSAVITAVA